jgi:hypothetical protein
MREFVVWNSMKNEYGNGSWCVTGDGIIYVRTHLGTKCTQLGGSQPDALARILMKELYYERAPGHIE